MRNDIVKSDRGQIMIIFAVIMPVLILFTGLAIDSGILYVTKAKLSTSVDAACLTGMKNLTLGQTTAATMATDMFQANFGPNPPTPSVTFPIDTHGNQQVKVTATAYVNTLFMQYLAQFARVPVGATAVATRGKLLMSVVLDRSGSMGNNGGGAALQYAVPLFIADFSNTLDEVAMVSFSSNATIDFPIAYNFWGNGSGTITSKVAAMTFNGGTFGTGAGTQPITSATIGAPLSLADAQNNSVTILPGQNVVKVVVYFTDGLMNAVQDNFYCLGTGGNGTTQTLINYGGYDSGSNNVAFLDPTCTPNSSGGCTNESGHVTQWDTCTSGCPSGFQYSTGSAVCTTKTGTIVTKFTPQQPGRCGDGSSSPCIFTRTNVTSEAQYRATQTAIAMRTEAPIPTYVFTIGMGSGVDSSTQNFLAKLANDPDPKYPTGTYTAGQPAGEFFYIPSCSGSALANCKTQLNTAFQTIAAKVLLRLTQ